MPPPPTNDDRRLVGAARDEFAAPGVMSAQLSGLGEMAGDVIHRYTLVAPLGEGGMGTVWLARQSEPVTRDVALKIVKLGMDTREVVARFEAERQALALMDHSGIAKVLDGGATEGGRPYFVMEHVDGTRITDHCDSRRMDVASRLALFVDVCEAVHHAHQKGVIHRDLKPGNVLVTRAGDHDIPKVIDFGIAKATHAELTRETLLTRGAQALGTPEYMAPEQASTSPLGIDTRVDIYSLGVLLYELLTGRRPFELSTDEPANIESLLMRVRDDEPSRPSTRLGLANDAAERVASARSTSAAALRRQLEGDLDWVVIRALEKDRDRRYASAHEFAADVRRFLNHEAVEAVPPSATYRLRKLVQRRRKAIVATAALLGVLVAGSIGTGIGWWNTRQSNLTLQRVLGEKDAALTQAQSARVAESKQRQRAEDEAARAREESERAARAEAESADRARVLQVRTEEVEERTNQLEERTAQIEQIAEFESETIGTVDATSMGIGLRAALLDEVPKDRRDGLQDALEGVNFTNLAIDTLRTNLLETRLSAIHSRFPDQPDVRARLLGSHAESRRGLGLPAEALPIHEQVVQLWTEIHGPEHVETLAAVTTLARARLENGDAAGSLQLVEANLAVLQRVHGNDHPESRRAYDLSGMAAYGVGDMARAERVMQAGVERRLQAGEHDDLATWDAIKGLSAVLWALSRRAEAMEMAGVALDGLRRTAPTDDPRLVAAIHNRASMLAFSGKLEDAEVLMLEALESERRARGDRHPTALAAAENLAILTSNLGRFEEAEAMLVACLEGFRETLGDTHPETLECQTSLAGFYRRQNRFADAETLLRNTLAGQRRVLGDEHPDVVASMGTLAELLFYTGELDDSLALWLRVYDITLSTKGDDHIDTSAAIRQLVTVYETQDQVDDAVDLLREAFDRRTKNLGDNNVATRQSREDLAFFLERHGRSEEAQRVRDG